MKPPSFNLVGNDAQAIGHAPDAGKAACRRAFACLSPVLPDALSALPVLTDQDDPELAGVLGKAVLGAVPYAAIAAEGVRALDYGVRATTPLAWVLLAALAAHDEAHLKDVLRLSRAALGLAERYQSVHRDDIRAIHMALIAPYDTATPGAELAAICKDQVTMSVSAVLLAATAFSTCMALPELSRHLDLMAHLPTTEDEATALELAARMRVLHLLQHRQAVPALDSLESIEDTHQDAQFGYWLANMETAWCSGNYAHARYAVDKATTLASPLLSVADRLTYHLFTALILGQFQDNEAALDLDWHCSALHKLTLRLPRWASGFSALAEAIRIRHRGDAANALRHFDGAGTTTSASGLHGLAALCWEQAARQANEYGLASAAQHYRRQALTSYERWGALGRADKLRDAWSEFGVASDDDPQAERARILRANSVGDFGLSVAHEVNQPLAAITLHAAAARKWLRREQPDIERALASLALISSAGKHAGDIVRSIQRMATRQDTEMGKVPVDQTIADALELLQRLLRKHGIDNELALGLGEQTIHANRVQLQQVVTNILVNAIEALAGNTAHTGPKQIRIQSRHLGANEIEIAVADNGPGIAPHNRERVFGSLFSTKANSTGMGLSISLAIIRAHRGHIEYEPGEPHGACFRFRLPIFPSENPPKPDLRGPRKTVASGSNGG